jgi:hypothetical protein
MELESKKVREILLFSLLKSQVKDAITALENKLELNPGFDLFRWCPRILTLSRMKGIIINAFFRMISTFTIHFKMSEMIPIKHLNAKGKGVDSCLLSTKKQSKGFHTESTYLESTSAILANEKAKGITSNVSFIIPSSPRRFNFLFEVIPAKLLKAKGAGPHRSCFVSFSCPIFSRLNPNYLMMFFFEGPRPSDF